MLPREDLVGRRILSLDFVAGSSDTSDKSAEQVIDVEAFD